MSAAFVKSLKRDYVRPPSLPDADTILALLPAWIDDYCEVHPHYGLNFRSPREFLRLSAQTQPPAGRWNEVNSKVINARSDERIARLASIIAMLQRAQHGTRSEKLRHDPLDN